MLLKVWKWKVQSNWKNNIQIDNNKDEINMSRASEVYESMNHSLEVQTKGIRHIVYTEFKERDGSLVTRAI